jgi:hypothetical protein
MQATPHQEAMASSILPDGEAQYAIGAILLAALEALPLFFTDPKKKKESRLMKYEPLAKSLIATSLALSLPDGPLQLPSRRSPPKTAWW